MTTRPANPPQENDLDGKPFATRVYQILSALPRTKSRREAWRVGVALRVARYVNGLPTAQRDEIRAKDNRDLAQWLRDNVFPRLGKIAQKDLSDAEPTPHEPGGDSNYSGIWARVQYPSGYVDGIADGSQYPASRQRVWAGIPPNTFLDPEIIIKAENEAALQEWGIDQGYGGFQDDGEGGQVFVWEVPIDYPIPIMVARAVFDQDGNVVTPAVLSDELHANIQVL